MKGYTIMAAALAGAVALGACGCSAGTQQAASDEKAAETSAQAQVQTSQTAQAAQKDFDGSKYSDTGAGTFAVGTSAGKGDGTNVPTVAVQQGASNLHMQFSAESKGFDRSQVTYVYIDGMQAAKANMGDSSQTVAVSGTQLAAGTHDVEAVQFAGGQPGGDVVLYKHVRYAVA